MTLRWLRVRCLRSRVLAIDGAIWLPGRASWHDGGGDQPLGSGDADVGASLEVRRPRLLRPEVGDLAEAVLAQQLVYLAGQEPAHERLAHLGGDPGERRRDLRGGAPEYSRWLVVGEHD